MLDTIYSHLQEEKIFVDCRAVQDAHAATEEFYKGVNVEESNKRFFSFGNLESELEHQGFRNGVKFTIKLLMELGLAT